MHGQYYCEEIDNYRKSAYDIQCRIERVEQQIQSLIKMRADDEITKDEYTNARRDINPKLERLKKLLAENGEIINQPHKQLDLEYLRCEVEKCMQLDTGFKYIAEKFVDKIITVDSNVFRWIINLDGVNKYETTLEITGRKGNSKIMTADNDGCLPSYFMLENPKLNCKKLSISSSAYDNLKTFQTKKSKIHFIPIYSFSIDFEQAKAYRKSLGMYLRGNQWEDMRVEVWVVG